MAKLHVEVTQEDIDNGVRGDPYSCMVRKAFIRCTEGALPRTLVTRREIRTNAGAGAIHIPFDEAVVKKIVAWDQGKSVRPFAFDLELPDSLFAVPS